MKIKYTTKKQMLQIGSFIEITKFVHEVGIKPGNRGIVTQVINNGELIGGAASLKGPKIQQQNGRQWNISPDPTTFKIITQKEYENKI